MLTVNSPRSAAPIKGKFDKKGRSLLDWMKVQRATKPIPASQLRKISMIELQQHNSLDDAWIAIEGIVFDVTKYMEFHPGGIDELMRGLGKDSTSLFYEIHQWVNFKAMLSQFQIGYIENNLIRRNLYAYDEFVQTTIRSISFINHDTILLTLNIPLFILIDNFNEYAFLRIVVTNKHLTKPYTIIPHLINSFTDKLENPSNHEITFLIKIYDKGPMTSQLAKAVIGDNLLLNFPFVSKPAQEKLLCNSNIVMLVAGSGFTPIIRVINNYYSKHNERMMYLFYFNKEERDIYYKKRLEKLARLNCRFKLVLVLSAPHKEWRGHVGRISSELLTSKIEASHSNTTWLICGPSIFASTSKMIIKTIKNENDLIFDYGTLG